jgi:hypothetical protein
VEKESPNTCWSSLHCIRLSRALQEACFGLSPHEIATSKVATRKEILAGRHWACLPYTSFYHLRLFYNVVYGHWEQTMSNITTERRKTMRAAIERDIGFPFACKSSWEDCFLASVISSIIINVLR